MSNSCLLTFKVLSWQFQFNIPDRKYPPYRRIILDAEFKNNETVLLDNGQRLDRNNISFSIKDGAPSESIKEEMLVGGLQYAPRPEIGGSIKPGSLTGISGLPTADFDQLWMMLSTSGHILDIELRIRVEMTSMEIYENGKTEAKWDVAELPLKINGLNLYLSPQERNRANVLLQSTSIYKRT